MDPFGERRFALLASPIVIEGHPVPGEFAWFESVTEYLAASSARRVLGAGWRPVLPAGREFANGRITGGDAFAVIAPPSAMINAPSGKASFVSSRS